MGNTQTRSKKTQTSTEMEVERRHEEHFTCEMCIEPIPSNNRFRNCRSKCVHPFCTDCVVKYIQLKVEVDHVADVQCPRLDCNQPLKPLPCRPVLAPQLFDKWCDALLGLDPCDCPSQKCSALVSKGCGSGNPPKRSVCPCCKRRYFCFRCSNLPLQPEYPLEELRKQRIRGWSDDVQFGLLAAEEKTGFNHFDERRRACNLVICRCGTKFCYTCGSERMIEEEHVRDIHWWEGLMIVVTVMLLVAMADYGGYVPQTTAA